jgi:hypothetical protein
MIPRIGFFALCAAAGSMPLVVHRPAAPDPVAPQWPSHFEGHALVRLPLSFAEENLNAGFPGQIARFTDGRRELILRWIATPSRRVHPSADCFRGLGYSVEPAPALLDVHGVRWSCFIAIRKSARLHVRERISGVTDDGSWTDVSAWFWAALFERKAGPWLAITVVENDTST